MGVRESLRAALLTLSAPVLAFVAVVVPSGLQPAVVALAALCCVVGFGKVAPAAPFRRAAVVALAVTAAYVVPALLWTDLVPWAPAFVLAMPLVLLVALTPGNVPLRAAGAALAAVVACVVAYAAAWSSVGLLYGLGVSEEGVGEPVMVVAAVVAHVVAVTLTGVAAARQVRTS